VVFLRHAATEYHQVDSDYGNAPDCRLQRNLSGDGRRQAKEIGAAFRTLGIPVGRVLSSPFCRTADTARLAFGQYVTSPALSFAHGAGLADRTAQSAALRRMLGTSPEAGLNTVIVSHHANLKEAVGVWPRQEGTAHVFRPTGAGGVLHLGEVRPDEWARCARSASRR
jgi:phosphohistidine phosphatase SixA